MNSTNFSIIIPNLNGSKLLPNCLHSLLLAIKNCPNPKFEIILVDNASTDNSRQIFKNFCKKNTCDFRLFAFNSNLGFAKAINQGAKLAQYSWIVPCNNDIKINKDWFKIISQSIKANPDVSTFFGTIKNHDGKKIESTGLKFFYSGKAINLQNKHTKPQIIWAGNGALIVYQKKIFKSLAGFDQNFFAYLEDVDLGFRLNQAGHKTLLIPNAISYHLGGTTSQRFGNLRQIKTVQNWIYLIVKNYSKKQFFSNLPAIIEQRLRNLSSLLKNTPFLLWLPTIIHVYGQIMIKLPLIIKKRCQKK